MKELEIELSKILYFRKRSRNKLVENELEETIKKLGHPLFHVYAKREGEKYLLYRGQGRVDAAKKAGLKKIKAYVFEENEITPSKMLYEYFWDNLCRPKYVSISKYKELSALIKAGADLNDVAKKYEISPITLRKGISMWKNMTKTLQIAEQNKIIDMTQVESISHILDEEAHKAIIELLEKEASSKEKNAFIRVAKSMDASGEKITVKSLRTRISETKQDMYDLKETNNTKRNRIVVLNRCFKILKEDKNFIQFLKKEGGYDGIFGSF